MIRKRLLIGALVMLLSNALGWSSDGRGKGHEPSKNSGLPGLWYVTGFFGPVDPDTPRLNAFMRVSGDGTALFDSTAETGKNPIFAFNPQGDPLGGFIPAHAVWARVKSTRKGRHAKPVYELRFASFADGGGPPNRFRMLLFTLRIRLDSRHRFSGLALASDVPCAAGAVGEPVCPNPQEVGYPNVVNNPLANPIFGKRITFQR